MSLFPYFIISTWKIKSICKHYGSYTAESEIDEKELRTVKNILKKKNVKDSVLPDFKILQNYHISDRCMDAKNYKNTMRKKT